MKKEDEIIDRKAPTQNLKELISKIMINWKIELYWRKVIFWRYRSRELKIMSRETGINFDADRALIIVIIIST